MAKFDESKIINCLHTDKAEVGKKYYFSDDLLGLKDHVEYEQTAYIGTLTAWHFGIEIDPDWPMKNETISCILYLAGDAKLKWLHDRMLFEINHKLYEEITI